MNLTVQRNLMFSIHKEINYEINFPDTVIEEAQKKLRGRLCYKT
jgi:hypothetical protein